MAKRSLILSNDDGRVTFSNTSSVWFEDSTNEITSSGIAADNLILPGLTANSVVTVANNRFSTLPTGSTDAGALVWNSSTSQWSASAQIVEQYVGVAGGDLSGSFDGPEGVKVVNISNVVSGTLSHLYGGTGASRSASSNILLKASSSGISQLSASASISGSVLTSVNGKWLLIPPGYPDVRFYEVSGSTKTYTWTRPPGTKFARVILQGAGGGGGQARTSPAAYTQGGGSGGYSDVVIDLKDVETVTVNVGRGGDGGTTGQTALGGDGSYYVYPQCGYSGGTTEFTCSRFYVYAGGGRGGGGITGYDPAQNNWNNNINTDSSGNSPRAGGGTGLSRNGSSGLYDQTSATVYLTPGGGGGRTNTVIGTPTKPVYPSDSLSYGYFFTSDGKEINLVPEKGANGVSASETASRPGYGAGGGGGWALGNINGGPGGHGYALIIAW